MLMSPRRSLGTCTMLQRPMRPSIDACPVFSRVVRSSARRPTPFPGGRSSPSRTARVIAIGKAQPSAARATSVVRHACHPSSPRPSGTGAYAAGSSSGGTRQPATSSPKKPRGPSSGAIQVRWPPALPPSSQPARREPRRHPEGILVADAGAEDPRPEARYHDQPARIACSSSSKASPSRSRASRRALARHGPTAPAHGRSLKSGMYPWIRNARKPSAYRPADRQAAELARGSGSDR